MGVAEPAFLQRPIRAVPTEDVGPLLLGRIGDQSGSGSPHLRRRCSIWFSERLEGQSQTSNGADYRQGSTCSARKDRRDTTFAPAGDTISADERARPSQAGDAKQNRSAVAIGLVAVNSLPTPRPEARPMSSETVPSSLVASAAARTLSTWPRRHRRAVPRAARPSRRDQAPDRARCRPRGRP